MLNSIHRMLVAIRVACMSTALLTVCLLMGCELMPRIVLDPIPPRAPGPQAPAPAPGPTPTPSTPTPSQPPSGNRAPTLVELDQMASALLRYDRTGRPLRGSIVEDAQRSGGVAAIQYSGNDSIIFVHPEARRRWSINSWAFVMGHELSHALLQHRSGGQDAEWEADRVGAQMAAEAGYDVAGYIEFVCTLPNTCSRSHGCIHDRMRQLENQHGAHGSCGMQRSAHMTHLSMTGFPGADFEVAGPPSACVTDGGQCTHAGPRCRIVTPVAGPDGQYEMREVDAPFCVE